MNYERLLAGYSYDNKGAYLILDNLKAGSRERLYLDSLTLSLKKKEQRFCVGSFDLASLKGMPCPTHEPIPSNCKQNSCTSCLKHTGFNPAFYNAKAISPQQQMYNQLPHLVYLAYFAPDKIKVGIAAKYRIAIRLLEQGARAATILQEFPDAYQARELERHINKTLHFPDNFRSSEKHGFLEEYQYSFKQANESLKKAFHTINVTPLREAIDLQNYYFYHKPLTVKEIFYCKENIINGKCVGMIGDSVIIAQDGHYFASSIRPYISHLVFITSEDVPYRYAVPSRQISMFEICDMT